MKCFIQLSKAGDLISALPIINAEYKETGQAPNLVVSKEYADAIFGASYIHPHFYEGLSSDLAGAIKWAKSKFDQVTVIQTHGKDFPIQHKTPGFQIDQYLRAGRISDWDKLPLVFDQRNRQREYALTSRVVGRKKEPFILFGDYSKSAPFPHLDELSKMLWMEFEKTHKIIRLSEVKAEHICDLIGLYEKASALLTVDTLHVHLSKASKVPTFVLARDGWAGASCSSHFRFYCRYGEWDRRKSKMIAELKNAIDGIKPIRISTIKTTFNHGYNLSVGENGMGIYRYHDRNDWRTSLAIVLKSGETHPLNADASLKDYSIEDARCFTFKGRPFASYTVGNSTHGLFSSYMAYGEITERDGVWSIAHIQPKYKGNNFTQFQKNWVPFVVDDKLFFIYGIENENQIVIQVDGDKVQAEHQSPAPKWGNGPIRGGSIVSHGDKMLRFFHSRADYPDKTFRYFVGASLMESKPPFATVAVGKGSILYGNENYTPDCKHWKPNVNICYGAMKDGEQYQISGGINDCKCYIAEISEKQLRL